MINLLWLTEPPNNQISTRASGFLQRVADLPLVEPKLERSDPQRGCRKSGVPCLARYGPRLDGRDFTHDGRQDGFSLRARSVTNFRFREIVSADCAVRRAIPMEA